MLARDLSSAYQFVRIAKRYRDAGRYDDALEWAEKGLAAFGTADHRLTDVAAEEYYRAGRPNDAVELEWRSYEARPAPGTYQQLHEQAARAGDLPDWRDRALTALRQRVEAQIAAQDDAGRSRGRSAYSSPLWWNRADAFDLVSVFLYEDDLEQAWSEARGRRLFACAVVQLARRCGDDHLLEVIPIWETEVDRAVATKNNQGYQQAVDAMLVIERLMTAAGQRLPAVRRGDPGCAQAEAQPDETAGRARLVAVTVDAARLRDQGIQAAPRGRRRLGCRRATCR